MSLYFATIIGALVRFFQLGLRPFDGDEGVVLWQISQPSFQDFWQAVSRDAHPPLTDALSWLGTHLFGVNEVGLRLFSAVFGVLLVPASYLLAKELIGPKQALFVAWLVALSPYLLTFSQEARMYAPLALFVTLALWALLKQKPWHFAVLAAAAIYTHYLGLLLLPLAAARKQWRALASVVLLVAPLVPLAVPQFIGRIQESPATNLANLATNLKGLVNVFYRFGAGRSFLGLEFNPQNHLEWLQNNPLSWFAFVMTLVIPALLFSYALVRNIRSKQWLPIWLLAGIAIIAALVSTEVGSRAARNLSFLAPAYLMALAAAAFDFKKTPKFAATVLLVAIAGLGIFNHHVRELRKPGAPAMVDYIHDAKADNPAVLARGAFLKGESAIFNHYWSSKYPNTNPPAVTDYYGGYRIGNLRKLRQQSVRKMVEQLLKDHPTVFFYDFSYQSHDLPGEPTVLGYDKENQPLALWRVDR